MRNFRPMETQKDAFAQVLLVRGRCYLSHLTTNVLGGVLVRRNCGDTRVGTGPSFPSLTSFGPAALHGHALHVASRQRLSSVQAADGFSLGGPHFLSSHLATYGRRRSAFPCTLLSKLRKARFIRGCGRSGASFCCSA